MSNSPLPQKQSENISAEELQLRFITACELQENDKPKEALSIYTELEQFLGDSPLLHYNMGLARFDLKDFEQAELHYTIAARGNPEDPDIHFNHGLNYRRLRRVEEAITSFSQAIELGDSAIDTVYNLALCHQDLGEFEKATRFYDIILSQNPVHLATLNNYAYLCHKSERYDKAKELYERLLQCNPEHEAAQHMLHSLNGTTPETAPLDYVEAVFDGFADTFEEKLLNDLAYQTPTELWQLYKKLFPESTARHCLDLGCGTGLAGVAFSPCCSELTGVDISDEILKVAHEKNLYRELVKADILSFLEKTDKCFDLILSADVFTYMGDLESVFKGCQAQAIPTAILCFSVEEANGDSFVLKDTGRFGHSEIYIQKVCERTGWTILSSSYSKLRQDRGEWIKGYLFILQKQ